MRLLHLTPGTGTFHCGSCLRDNALIKALRTRGHDALMVPLYLPLVTDRDAANPEIPVQVGGISLYLQQKIPWFRHLPRAVHRWLDQPQRLRIAARFMGMTSARDLGEMALGALQGEQGRQWPEWQRLIEWIRNEAKPDVVSLSNSLLMGLCPTLQRNLGVPVIVSLQGEDSFLDTLVEPYRERSWAAMRANAQHVTRFISPSQFYADLMRQKLGVDASRIAVVHNGLDTQAFATATPDPLHPIIGYFARMIHGKGLTTLVDAFIELAKRDSMSAIRLKIGGAKTDTDEPYLEGLRQKLAAAGLAERVQWHPNVSYEEKLAFFRDLSVFSVPATYGEAFGLYILEAMSSGVPVVQPTHGAFPELIAATGGGVLCPPDDPTALANALEALLRDPARRQSLADQGQTGVREAFSADKMAEHFDRVLAAVKNL